MRAIGVAVTALVLVGPGSASAQNRVESPRNGEVRLSLGGYRPAIDSESALQTDPFRDTFGGSSMLLFRVEYDRYFFQRYGSLGAGISAGYSEKYGSSVAVGDTEVETSEKTALILLPLRLHVFYKFDVLALKWRIPLVPYLKGGVSYVPWRVTKGGRVEEFDGRRGEGGKWGAGGTGGIAFLLDVLEPRLARDFDADVGVNHSYLFAEYEVLRTGVFGGGGLNLSSSHFMFGLALEF